MMKIKEIRDDYVRYSTDVSNLSRNLSFAGIGIIWIFKATEHSEAVSIPAALLFPLFLFIIALGLDIFQYILQTAIWYIYYLIKKPRKNSTETEDTKYVHEPEWLNAIPWGIWFAKTVCVVCAYWRLGKFVFPKVFQ